MSFWLPCSGYEDRSRVVFVTSSGVDGSVSLTLFASCRCWYNMNEVVCRFGKYICRLNSLQATLVLFCAIAYRTYYLNSIGPCIVTAVVFDI